MFPLVSLLYLGCISYRTVQNLNRVNRSRCPVSCQVSLRHQSHTLLSQKMLWWCVVVVGLHHVAVGPMAGSRQQPRCLQCCPHDEPGCHWAKSLYLQPIAVQKSQDWLDDQLDWFLNTYQQHGQSQDEEQRETHFDRGVLSCSTWCNLCRGWRFYASGFRPWAMLIASHDAIKVSHYNLIEASPNKIPFLPPSFGN